MDTNTTPLQLATAFHEIYERRAPDFGYETRTETRSFNPETPNGRLMIAVCAELLSDTWQPIETAPKDGTMIDLWSNGRRVTDSFWGKPDHSCGEMGEYCDSDWHGAGPGWVDTMFGEFLEEKPTHWMPRPKAPPIRVH